jgi:hypothetical protein
MRPLYEQDYILLGMIALFVVAGFGAVIVGGFNLFEEMRESRKRKKRCERSERIIAPTSISVQGRPPAGVNIAPGVQP